MPRAVYLGGDIIILHGFRKKMEEARLGWWINAEKVFIYHERAYCLCL